MMSLFFAFWLFVILFAVIGAIRGWAKELLVVFSVFLSLALLRLMERFVPVISTMPGDDPNLFWVRALLLIIVVFFGYQTTHIPRVASKGARDKLQDGLLGGILGGFNGYLIAGTLWFDMAAARYPFSPHIIAPDPSIAERVNTFLAYMPPNLLGDPGIYFAVIFAFIFVLVVYI